MKLVISNLLSTSFQCFIRFSPPLPSIVMRIKCISVNLLKLSGINVEPFAKYLSYANHHSKPKWKCMENYLLLSTPNDFYTNTYTLNSYTIEYLSWNTIYALNDTINDLVIGCTSYAILPTSHSSLESSMAP